MTPWDEYTAAVRQLDEARRDAVAAVVAQECAAGNAQDELGGVRQRISLQRSHLTDVAVRLTRVPPLIEPLAAERGSASLIVPISGADPTTDVTVALKGAKATMDAADATLSIVADLPPRHGLLPSWSPVARNVLAYGWYATLALIALVFIGVLAGDSAEAKTISTVFDLAVPAGAWVLAWFSIGLVFGPDHDGDRPRSPLLGGAICFLPMVIGLLLAIR